MSDIKCACIKAGQQAAYCDEVNKYAIVAEGATREEVLARCRLLPHVDHFDVPGTHDGHCGFPYGLDSYSTLIDEGNGAWTYCITTPFCD